MRYRVRYNGKMWLPSDADVLYHWSIARNGELVYRSDSDVPDDIDTAVVMFGMGILDMAGNEIFERDIFNLYMYVGGYELGKDLELISPGNAVELADFLGGHYWLIHHGHEPRYQVIGNTIDNEDLVHVDERGTFLGPRLVDE